MSGGGEAVPKKVPPKLLTAILVALTMESKVSANKNAGPKTLQGACLKR